MNKLIMSFLSLSVVGLFLGGAVQAQSRMMYVQFGSRCRVYRVVGTKWDLIQTLSGSCSQYNRSSNSSSVQSNSVQSNISSIQSVNSPGSVNTMASYPGLLSVHNVPLPNVPLSSYGNATRIGHIWEYYPQNSTCHLVRYIEYNNTDPTIHNKYRYIRQVIEGYSNISNELCGFKSIYGKTIYTSVNLNDSRWQWGYNPSNRQWQWNYQ